MKKTAAFAAVFLYSAVVLLLIVVLVLVVLVHLLVLVVILVAVLVIHNRFLQISLLRICRHLSLSVFSGFILGLEE